MPCLFTLRSCWRNFQKTKTRQTGHSSPHRNANQLETARALLHAGASIEGASDRSHIRPLWKAAKRGHLQMVKLLVGSGANVSATDNTGMSALDYAKRYSRTDVVEYLKSLNESGV